MSKIVIVEIMPDCVRDPIRFACLFGDSFSDTTGVIVGNDYPIGDKTRYFLEVSCTKADMDSVSHFIGSHYRLNRETSGETSAENRDTFCVKGKDCPLRLLTIEKLLIPLLS